MSTLPRPLRRRRLRGRHFGGRGRRRGRPLRLGGSVGRVAVVWTVAAAVRLSLNSGGGRLGRGLRGQLQRRGGNALWILNLPPKWLFHIHLEGDSGTLGRLGNHVGGKVADGVVEGGVLVRHVEQGGHGQVLQRLQ